MGRKLSKRNAKKGIKSTAGCVTVKLKNVSRKDRLVITLDFPVGVSTKQPYTMKDDGTGPKRPYVRTKDSAIVCVAKGRQTCPASGKKHGFGTGPKGK